MNNCEPVVCVLLSTYNGEKYLESQIDSILCQKGVRVKLQVRDDGSSDDTQRILKKYSDDRKLRWIKGDNVGPARSFLELLSESEEADYYAFADQDDYWIEDKLQIAVSQLSNTEEIPQLYYGSARIADENLRWRKQNTKPYKNSNFYSAMILSNAIGCTFVFNRTLRNIVNEGKPEYVFMHDAWVHKLCAAVNGFFYFDEDVHILYRQHANNVIGVKTNICLKIINYLKRMGSKEGVRSKQLSSLLSCYERKMPVEYAKKCKELCEYRIDWRKKIKVIFDKDLRTNYALLNARFILAILLDIF